MASFRRHQASESSRLLHEGAVWEDLARAISIIEGHLPASIRRSVTSRSVDWHVASAIRTARRSLAAGEPELARRCIAGARSILARARDPTAGSRSRRRIERAPGSPLLLPLRTA